MMMMNLWMIGQQMLSKQDCEIVLEQSMILVVLKKCRGSISMIRRSTILSLYFDTQRKRFLKTLNL